jgi:hypothetical protein
MIYLWLLSAGLIGLACKEITWRQLGDLITFIVVFSVGLTLLVLVVAGGSTFEKLFGLGVFMSFIYLTA